MIFLFFAMKTQRKISAAQMSSAENFFCMGDNFFCADFFQTGFFLSAFLLAVQGAGTAGHFFLQDMRIFTHGKKSPFLCCRSEKGEQRRIDGICQMHRTRIARNEQEHRLRTAQSSRKFVLLIRFFPYMFSGKSPCPQRGFDIHR